MQKACSKCLVTKDAAFFYASGKASDGLASWCKQCANGLPRNRDAYARDYSPEQKRRWHLKSRYGITPEQVDEMREAQNGQCAICDINLASLKRVHIDHCHDTKRVRGLLCHRCNIRLGGWDDPVWRARADAYMGVF